MTEKAFRKLADHVWIIFMQVELIIKGLETVGITVNASLDKKSLSGLYQIQGEALWSLINIFHPEKEFRTTSKGEDLSGEILEFLDEMSRKEELLKLIDEGIPDNQYQELLHILGEYVTLPWERDTMDNSPSTPW